MALQNNKCISVKILENYLVDINTNPKFYVEK